MEDKVVISADNRAKLNEIYTRSKKGMTRCLKVKKHI